MADGADSRSIYARGVLKEVERMLVKFRTDPSASLGLELARIDALFRECGHTVTTTEEDILPDVSYSQDLDALVNELSDALYEAAETSEDRVVGEHLIDCLREGDINTLIRRSDYVSYIFDSIDESTASQPMLSFLGCLFYLVNLKDCLAEGPILLDQSDYDDDEDDEDDEEGAGDFTLGDQLFPPET